MTDDMLPATSEEVERAQIIEECAQIAEGPIYKERYRGVEDHNWSADRHHSNLYGNGRMGAADAIRALAAQPLPILDGECVHVPMHIEGKGYRCRDCGAPLVLMGQGDSVEWAAQPLPKPAIEAVTEADIYEQASLLAVPWASGTYFDGIEAYRKALGLKAKKLAALSQQGGEKL